MPLDSFDSHPTLIPIVAFSGLTASTYVAKLRTKHVCITLKPLLCACWAIPHDRLRKIKHYTFKANTTWRGNTQYTLVYLMHKCIETICPVVCSRELGTANTETGSKGSLKLERYTSRYLESSPQPAKPRTREGPKRGCWNSWA